jgi:hypothetical protein
MYQPNTLAANLNNSVVWQIKLIVVSLDRYHWGYEP